MRVPPLEPKPLRGLLEEPAGAGRDPAAPLRPGLDRRPAAARGAAREPAPLRDLARVVTGLRDALAGLRERARPPAPFARRSPGDPSEERATRARTEAPVRGLVAFARVAPERPPAVETGARPRRLPSEPLLRRRLEDVARGLAALFARDFPAPADEHAEEARSRLRDAVAVAVPNAHPDDERVDTGLGLLFDWSAPDGHVLRIDGPRLAESLAGAPDALASLLLGARGTGDDPAAPRPGLLELLDLAAAETTRAVLPALDPADALGLVIDLRG